MKQCGSVIENNKRRGIGWSKSASNLSVFLIFNPYPVYRFVIPANIRKGSNKYNSNLLELSAISPGKNAIEPEICAN
jgi:hypothetical protein